MNNNTKPSGDGQQQPMHKQPTSSDQRDRDEQMLAHLVHHRTPVHELARLLDGGLMDVARWAGDPANWQLALALARATELQAAMVLSLCRPRAAAELLSMATGKETTEQARRACVDLLSVQMDVLATRDVAERTTARATNPFAQPVGNAQLLRSLMGELALHHEHAMSESAAISSAQPDGSGHAAQAR